MMQTSKQPLLQVATVNGKTTAGMAAAGVAYLINRLVVPLLDGDDFAGLITPDVLKVAFDLVMAGGLIFAGIWQRDANKSSQDNAARLPVKEEAIDYEAVSDEALGREK